MEDMYIVYMHENKVNYKKYIGITKNTIKKRSCGGYGYVANGYFYASIKKYGWKNFRHKVLFRNLTREEAEAKEIELIKEYNTTSQEFGYNLHTGGKFTMDADMLAKTQIGRVNKSKRVWIACDWGKKEPVFYDNIEQASIQTGMSKNYIKNCCMHRISQPRGYTIEFELEKKKRQ